MPDVTAGFHGGNPESVAANESIEDHKPTIRRRIAGYVHARGPVGATVDEIEIALGYSHQTASARVTELKQLGSLVPTGDRRPTRSGSSAAVLVAVDDICPAGESCRDCL